ncbi:MAG: hypothetical protein ABIP44_01710 [Pseudoxanthomonas sp.]
MDRPRKRRWRLSADAPAKAAFAVALILAGFGYGIATLKYHLFPYQILNQAQQAYDALTLVEKDQQPPHFIRFLEAGDTNRILKPASGAQSDLILMTGGFFYRTDLCPKFGCIAWIMRRDGTVLHRWSQDPAALFSAADMQPITGSPKPLDAFVQGVALGSDGTLTVIFQTRNAFPDMLGIAKLAPDGTVLWKRVDRSHHWPTVGPDGRIYTPFGRTVRAGPSIHGLPYKPECRGDAIDDQGVRVLSPDGQVLHTFWMADSLRQSGYRALTYVVRNDCDPFHVNGIALVDATMAAKLVKSGIGEAKPGDMFVSLRSSSSLVLMDADTGLIKHVIHGPMVGQHSPVSLPDGDLLVFDNLGIASEGYARSRLLKVRFAPERYQQMFPVTGGDDPQLYTKREGQATVSADGRRALAAETEGGRLFEIELATGKVLWAYREVNDLGAYEARAGVKHSGRPALLHTQGAAFVSQADFARMFGGT